MASHGTHFDFDPGRLPVELPVRWGTAPAWTIGSGVPGALDNRILRRAAVSGDYHSYVQWTRPGLTLTQTEILVRFRLAPQDAADGSLKFLHSIAGVRMGGDRWIQAGTEAANARGYLLQYNGSSLAGVGQRLQLLKVTAGGAVVGVVVLATHVLVINPDQWYLARLRADGTTISAKVWHQAVAEPGSWQMSVTDATHASGGAGPVIGHGQGFFDAMAVTTAGETAALPAVGAPPAVPALAVLAGCQDVTLFEDDDVTPIGGAVVDASGNVLLATYSTHPDHPRPWLIRTEDFGESRINFREGTGIIGACTWNVVDKRTDPANQDSGHFTALMTRGGYGRILNRRVLMRQQNADGTWRVLMDGVMVSHRLNDDLASYSVPTRDIRERERTMRAFTRNNGAWSIFPPGPASDYGRSLMSLGGVTATRVLMPGVAGYPGTARTNGPTGAMRVKLDVPAKNRPPLIRGLKRLRELKDWGAPRESYDVTGGAFRPRFTDVIVEWRPIDGSGNPTGAWVRLVDMPQIAGTTVEAGNVFVPGVGKGLTVWNATWNDLTITLNSLDPAVLPAHLQRVQVRVLSNRAPSEEAPIYGEGNIGDLVKAVLDGKTSDADTAPVRYNIAAMASFVGRGFYGRWKITEPWDNALQALAEKVWKPTGYAPAIVDGLVHPIAYALPGADVALAEFTNANTISADWSHGGEDVVTLAQFEFPRDYVEPNDPEEPTEPWQRVAERLQKYDRKAASASIHGRKVLTYNGEMFRSITFDPGGVSSAAELAAETGRDLAMRRLVEAIDRFAEGAPHMEAIAHHRVIQVPLGGGLFRPARPGDWAIMGCTWLPDYRTGRRGMNRLVQIVAVNPLDEVSSSYALVDAGPLNQPLPQVVVNAVQAEPDGTVSVNVGELPYHGTKPVDAAVQFAVADVQPAVDSTDWVYLTRAQKPGRYYSRPLPAGTTAWVRWRGEREGERPSAWSAAVSVTVVGPARIGEVAVSVGAGGVPVVTWSALPGTLGVQVRWAVYAFDETPPEPGLLGSSADVNASLGTYTIPVVLLQGERIRVTVTAYPGWTGAAVSGAAGQVSNPVDAIDPETNPVVFDPNIWTIGAEKVGAGDAGTTMGEQVTQSDGANTFTILRGRQSSPRMRNGDTWTFPVPYAFTPSAIVKAMMCATFHNGLSTALPMYLRLLTEMTPATLKLVAELVQPGVTTLRTAAFAAGALDSVGDQRLTVALGANTPANDSNYTIQFDVYLDVEAFGTSQSANLTLGFYSSPDGTTWTLRGTRSYNVGPTTSFDSLTLTNQTITLTVGGLGSAAKFKIVVESLTPSGGGRIVTTNNSGDEVRWNTAADTVQSATAHSDSGVEYEVVGVS